MNAHAPSARIFAALVGLVAAVVGVGCSSEPRVPDNPVTRALDGKQTEENRVKSVHEAFARAVTESDRIGVRTELTPQIWSKDAAPALKVAIVEELLAEKSERSAAEIREELRLNLPLQSSREVVAVVCKAAAERGWSEFVPAIVRTWAGPLPPIKDEDRVERAAIAALTPDAPGSISGVESTVFSVFVKPPADTPATRRMKLEERYRLAAWEVLSRLDPTGEHRVAMMEAVPPGTLGAPRPAFVDELLAARRELGILPAFGEELLWLRRLRDGKSSSNAAWWTEAASATGSLGADQRAGLELRHIEAVRWASKHRSAWIGSSKDQLAAAITQKLKDRPVHEATGNRPSGRGRILETYADALPRMCWADMLTVLVVCEAIESPGVAESLFTYAGYDERDTKTEYGGLIQAVEGPDAGGKPFIATLYAPRPGDRYDDRRFVASQDMVDASDRALLHWHFHVAERSNAQYAGPSLEDLDYAGRQGRTCAVFTSLDGRRLNADYFQRGGIIIDLGVVRKPGE